MEAPNKQAEQRADDDRLERELGRRLLTRKRTARTRETEDASAWPERRPVRMWP